MHRSIRIRALSSLAAEPLTPPRLPGFGRPLAHEPHNVDLIPSILHPFDSRPYMPMTLLREFTMCRIMDGITDKPDWHEGIKDLRIRDKWQLEAWRSGPGVTRQMVNWCIEELSQRADKVPKHPGLPPPPIFVFNGDVYKTDEFTESDKLRRELQEAVREFEKRIPEDQRDLRTGSNGKIWDLVNPSLFPLVYGRTRILADGTTTTLDNCIHLCGQGETIPAIPSRPPPNPEQELDAKRGKKPKQKERTLEDSYSKKFQWLPCVIDVSKGDIRIASYINNLHPIKDQKLYKLINEFLAAAAVPMWDRIVATLQHGKARKRLRYIYQHVRYKGSQKVLKEDSPPPEERGKKKKSKKKVEVDFVLLQPDLPDTFKFYKRPVPISLREQCRLNGFQVIVKMVNIQLTPDKPEYEGEEWQVDGQLNEHIASSIFYCYEMQNITPSSLNFRQLTDPKEVANFFRPKGAKDWLPGIFGIEENGPAWQEVGGVKIREGRLIGYPNLFQHRLGSFSLDDKKKPGHMKMLVLHLVDPNIKIISTAHVPCQRKDWWEDWKQNTPKRINLPPVEPPVESADFPITREEGEQLKEEMMKERKEFVDWQNEVFRNRIVSPNTRP